MKTYKKSAFQKLVSNFDIQLMNILMSDLKAIKERNLSRSAI
jgi:hypothetical protein